MAKRKRNLGSETPSENAGEEGVDRGPSTSGSAATEGPGQSGQCSGSFPDKDEGWMGGISSSLILIFTTSFVPFLCLQYSSNKAGVEDSSQKREADIFGCHFVDIYSTSEG